MGLWAALWESRGSVRSGGGGVGRAWNDGDSVGGELIIVFALYINPPQYGEQLFPRVGPVTSNCTCVC